MAPHGRHQRVVGVQHRRPITRHGLDHDLLDRGQLTHRGDAADSQVVAGDVEDDGHVIAVVAQPGAQNAAAGHLEDGHLHVRVLEHGRG